MRSTNSSRYEDRLNHKLVLMILFASLCLNPTLTRQIGHLKLSLAPAIADTFQYSYDPASGRIITSTDTTSGQIASYTYDAVGNMIGIQISNQSTATLGSNDSGNTATIAYNGQPLLLTFSGSMGQSLTLNVNSGGIPGVTVNILNPDGSQATIQSITCSSGGTPPACNGSEVINLAMLPSTGTYQIVVQTQPVYTGSGTLYFSLVNRVTNALPSVFLPAILNIIKH